VQHDLDWLRVRRAAQLRRRRRRAFALGLLAAMLGVVALGVSEGASHRSLPKAAGLAPSPHFVVPRGSRLAAQLAAVRRLAAHGLPLYCGGRKRRMVALTFDDGPGPYTRLAIKQLRRKRLHATFFLVGKQIRAYQRLAGREKSFAAVGDHTMTHPFLPALSHAAMVREIVAARTVIERAADQPVIVFRPPYEAHTPAIDREVRALGMLEVLWNVDSADSLGANYARIERNVVSGLAPGSIILMHENRGQTIRALPVIFAALSRRHLQAVTVPELVAADPPSLRQLRSGERGCAVVADIGTGT
jgi:peptidoglycan/xylan/chitin deacetylase (PgdA/CDA1 family)